jgi:hypothetical protein
LGVGGAAGAGGGKEKEKEKKKERRKWDADERRGTRIFRDSGVFDHVNSFDCRAEE